MNNYCFYNLLPLPCYLSIVELTICIDPGNLLHGGSERRVLLGR